MFWKILNSVLLPTMFSQASAVTLLRSQLTDPNALCNDGSQAVYYHQQDVRDAGSKVLVVLAGSGYCSTIEECIARCTEQPELCGSPGAQILEKEGGVWSDQFSPFDGHFKVFVPSCSSDSFSGRRIASEATGGLHFQGRNIVQAVLEDLESRLGAAAASIVLLGSGDAGRGAVEACDNLGRLGRLRCIVDGGEVVPWWVQPEEEERGCLEPRQLEKDSQQDLWGDNLCSKVEHCSPLDPRWSSPLLVLSAQLDVAQFTSGSCPLPLDNEPLTLAWRAGLVALAEARALAGSVSIFVPNCPTSRPLIAGQWNTSAALLGNPAEKVTLREVVESWLSGIHVQAVDTVAEENQSCQLGPSEPLTLCRNGSNCAGWTTSYSHSSGYSPRLAPPRYLFPSSYSRSCTLDPYWPSCTDSTKFEPTAHSHGVVPSTVLVDEQSRRQRLWQKVQVLEHLRRLYKKYKNAYTEEYHGIGKTPILHTPVVKPTILRPEVITPVVERPTVVRPTVIRPNVVRPTVVRPRVVNPNVVRPTVLRPSVVRRPPNGIPPVLAPDYDYDYSEYDYGDYPVNDYYDYADIGNTGGCSGGCRRCVDGCGAGGCPGTCLNINPCGGQGCKGNLFARIVKAAREERRKKGIRGGLLKELVQALERENIDYEDFGRTGRNVEQKNRNNRRGEKVDRERGL